MAILDRLVTERKDTNSRSTPAQESGAREVMDDARARQSPSLRVAVVAAASRARAALCSRLSELGHVAVELDMDRQTLARRVGGGSRFHVVLLDLDDLGVTEADLDRDRVWGGVSVPLVGLSARPHIEEDEVGDGPLFACLEKPVEIDDLADVLLAAARAARRDAEGDGRAPHPRPSARLAWLWGHHGFRPIIVGIGFLLLAGLALAPTPSGMRAVARAPVASGATASQRTNHRSADHGSVTAAAQPHPDRVADAWARWSGRTPPGQGASATNHRPREPPGRAETSHAAAWRARSASHAALVSLVLLCLAVLFWATGALPIAFTAVFAVAALVLFGVVTPARLADICFTDAVLLVFGVLALAQAVSATGLDQRIGTLVLAQGGVGAFFWVGVPLVALWAAFLPELVLMGCLAPAVVVACLGQGEGVDRSRVRRLCGAMLLALCFAANLGGPGSPVAGGRNALMLGLLSDHGVHEGVLRWMIYGLPFVPVAGLAVGIYFWLRIRRDAADLGRPVAAALQRRRAALGPWQRGEVIVALVLLLVGGLWLAAPRRLGLAGPPLVGLALLAALRAVRWRDVVKLPWDVVLLYACASGLGAAVAHTGAGRWLASTIVQALPDALVGGRGLLVSAGMAAGVLTNIMPDGAAVASAGPVVLPLAHATGTSLWLVGLVTAFASSFANVLLIATPVNAVVYATARDPRTGDRILSVRDFVVHGLAVTALAFALLFGWAVFGYWRWLS